MKFQMGKKMHAVLERAGLYWDGPHNDYAAYLKTPAGGPGMRLCHIPEDKTTGASWTWVLGEALEKDKTLLDKAFTYINKEA